jgi:predicted RNA-binding Zn-ribbon protein involved in translation (DUF1610 family)
MPIVLDANTRSLSVGGFSDELYTRFWVCPNCEFERIPRAFEYDVPDAEDHRYRTARYCPGCGDYITWKDNAVTS